MILNIEKFNCTSCPALYLKDSRIDKLKIWEKMRENAISSINQINIFLLGESIPNKRFFYDKQSDYSKDGLRFLLRQELINDDSDEKLFGYMRTNGIVLTDCAVCPLHKLNENNDKILAATFCLSRNTKLYLSLNPNAPIITIFPYKRGFDKNSLPDIGKRIVANFQFTNLNGLKKTIEKLLNKNG